MLIATIILSACGIPVSEPIVPTRQLQLSDANLFGRHTLTGVNVENDLEGEISGGFFLLAGGIDGQISSTTSFALTWWPTSTRYTTVNLPRSLIYVNIVEGLNHPEIEFVFKKNWLEGVPSFYIEYDNVYGTEDDKYARYTDGTKMNLNYFITVDNLDAVNVYVSPRDLTIPNSQ